MTGRIIPLRGDPHERVVMLLPWFVSGGLDDAERTEVETHLRTCPPCRAEAEAERGLKADIAALPLDVDFGWAKLSDRLDAGSRFDGGRGKRQKPPRWASVAIALQAAAILLLLVAIPASRDTTSGQKPGYHALSASTPATPSGNALVMFRPDTPENVLRASLELGEARLVDGPTAAGAYVVRVPEARRAQVLALLRRRGDVVLAQPIDPGPP